MEKILAFFIPSFFIPSFFIPSFFIPSLSGGVTYKLFLDSSKSPILFKLLKFRLLTLLKGDNSF
ncbi:hypothetical protein OHP005_08660 [Helicobacter pylori]|uniref:hypothetical protein n=1 Tax=Helicobacter pylori TaxID=210 RepID=UPI001CC774FB|nr:hypothetical protein [Helicobacter pylori]BDA05109.1 hypothetical protein OHP005_08660 [Helicobacter pylori]